MSNDRSWTLSRIEPEMFEMPEGVKLCEPIHLTNGVTSIILPDGLTIRHNSNFELPYTIEGAGGARVHISFQQLVEITLEFLRFQAGANAKDQDQEMVNDHVAFKARVWVKAEDKAGDGNG